MVAQFIKYIAPIICIAFASLSAQEIKRVFTKYQPANNFKTLTSYFTSGEQEGPRTIVRSDESAWNGMYFILEFDDRPETFDKKVSVSIDVLTPFSPDPKTYSFVLENSHHFSWEAYLGITGSEWPDEEASPLAWKITIKDFSGAILSQKQSFLWE